MELRPSNVINFTDYQDGETSKLLDCYFCVGKVETLL